MSPEKEELFRNWYNNRGEWWKNQEDRLFRIYSGFISFYEMEPDDALDYMDDLIHIGEEEYGG